MYNIIKNYFRNKYLKEDRPSDLISRINIGLRDNRVHSNCMGAAFYFTGIIEREVVIASTIADSYLKNTYKVKKPQVGALVVVRSKHDYNNEITHMCTIYRTKPSAMVVHRIGETGKVKINSLEKTFAKYISSDYTIDFHVSRKR